MVLGANPGAASYAGFPVKRLVVVVMAISGGLAGFAGAVEVGGVYQRIVDNMGEGFGLAGIAVALIARLEPAAIPFAACLFGIFFAGAGALQRELALPFPAGVDRRGDRHLHRHRAALGHADAKSGGLMDHLLVTGILAAGIRLGMAIGLAAIGESASERSGVF